METDLERGRKRGRERWRQIQKDGEREVEKDGEIGKVKRDPERWRKGNNEELTIKMEKGQNDEKSRKKRMKKDRK